ncbi:hypothetical protein [Gynuella sp.]|uniref:hypothetical protein n=1 Tax=Gynuella sp. TaxID=2969146 RepID=UPI003D103040
MKYSVILLLTCFVLQGCSQLHIQPSTPEARLDKLLEQEKYHNARLLLAHQNDKALVKHYTSALNMLEPKKINEIIRISDEAIEEQQWFRAKQIVENGMHLIGQKQELKKQLQKIVDLRNQHIRTHQNSLLLKRAHFLLQQYSDIEAIAEALPRNRAMQIEYRNLKQDMKTSARQLYELAQTTLEQGDAGKALRVANLSYQLHADIDTRELLIQLEEDRRKNRSEQQTQASEARSKHVDSLIMACDQAMTDGNLLSAKTLLEQIKQTSPNPSDWLLRQKRLDTRIAQQVQNALDEGQVLYSEGFIQEAVDLWTKTEKLDPDNETLKEYISRARRFLENIEKLSDQTSPSE